MLYIKFKTEKSLNQSINYIYFVSIYIFDNFK